MIIKELKQGKYALAHHWFDDFPPREMLEFTYLDDKGQMYHVPFMGFLKVTNYDKGRHIFEPTDYTDQDYQEMLDQQIASHPRML